MNKIEKITNILKQDDSIYRLAKYLQNNPKRKLVVDGKTVWMGHSCVWAPHFSEPQIPTYDSENDEDLRIFKD